MHAIVSAGVAELIPLPSANISTRLATMDDLPAIDTLQKQHHKQLGFFPRAQMEGYIRSGWMVVAEEAGIGSWALGVGEDRNPSLHPAVLPTPNAQLPTPLLGYCASRDRYLKRDELGAIYQLCVVPGRQRSFIGANLLKSVFDRSAYGTRLYCCWCAQDLAANHFWEAMGFVPLAYRAGSEKRGRKGGARVHIFWQKRIRAGDAATPWWFPSKTEGGAIRGDRIVLPILPGTHWSEAKPLVLPNADDGNILESAQNDEMPARTRVPDDQKTTKRKANEPAAPKRKRALLAGGLSFAAPPSLKPVKIERAKAHRKPATAAKMAKTDPRLIAAARELRDRWLEQINEMPLIDCGKYAVARVVPAHGEPRRLAA